MQQHKQQHQQGKNDILMRPQFMPIFEQAAVNFQNSFQQGRQQQQSQLPPQRMMQMASPDEVKASAVTAGIFRGGKSGSDSSRWGRNYEAGGGAAQDNPKMLMSDSSSPPVVRRRHPHQIDAAESSSSSLSFDRGWGSPRDEYASKGQSNKKQGELRGQALTETASSQFGGSSYKARQEHHPKVEEEEEEEDADEYRIIGRDCYLYSSYSGGGHRRGKLIGPAYKCMHRPRRTNDGNDNVGKAEEEEGGLWGTIRALPSIVQRLARF